MYNRITQYLFHFRKIKGDLSLEGGDTTNTASDKEDISQERKATCKRYFSLPPDSPREATSASAATTTTTSAGGYNTYRRNGIVQYHPSCQDRRNGIIPAEEDNNNTQSAHDKPDNNYYYYYDNNERVKPVSERGKRSGIMRKVATHTTFRHTFSDGTDFNSQKINKVMGKKKYKSLSLDGTQATTVPGCLNPVFLNYGCDSLESSSITVDGCVIDESCPDMLPDDNNSVFSDSNNSSDFDISGVKGNNIYPWQREVGIQCNLIRISSTKGDTDSPESKIYINNNIPARRDLNQKKKNRNKSYLLKTSYSLDSNQRQNSNSTLNKRLDKIRELESEAAKQRSLSRTDAVEQSTEYTSKTCSASYNISKPSFYRTGSTFTVNSDSGSFRLDKSKKKYGSVSNLSPTKTPATDFGYLDINNRNDILPSPPLSPKPWITSSSNCPLVRVYSPEERRKGEKDDASNKLVRRKSSDSIHSNEDDSDSEPSPTMLRQGRRKAIFDSMALGVITAPDGDLSPSNSCDESESSNHVSSHSGEKNKTCTTPVEKKFSDDLSTVHRKKVLIKRNTVHDFASNKSYQSVFTEQDSKKNKSSFSLVMKLIDKKGHKGKDSLADLSDVLQTIKPTEFKDHSLISYKTLHWSELIASKEKEKDVLTASDGEIKRREAVWELFQSECVFLVDHLMVLKHCFMEPMKKVQVEGHLMFAEPQDLFGNLDELCYVSYTFCKDFISLLLKDARVSDFGRTEVLVKALQRLSQLTRDGEVYHDYCLNYSKAVNYLEILRKNDKFCDFERWCENDPRCHRLQLTDLLISPMQHCTKVPLLLFNIRKYTEDYTEREQLTHSLEKLETSLKKLEAKMNWLKNFERVQEIQQQIHWPPVTELDQKAYIPEFLRPTLSRQPCERLLASPKRQLLHEGPVTLIEISKALDMYMFLFDDILLLTKVKKQPRKKSDGDRNPYAQRAHTEGAVFVVHRQPIALDRFTVHDVQPPDNSVGPPSDPCPFNCTSVRGVSSSFQGEGYQPLINVSMDEDDQGLGNLFFGCVSVANGLRHAFVLVQISRFQQIIGVFTIQAPSEIMKETWMSKLKEAQDKYKDVTTTKKDTGGLPHANSILVNCDEAADNATMEHCLLSYLDNKSNSSSGNKQNHEPIICTPQAKFSRAKTINFNDSESDKHSSVRVNNSAPISGINDKTSIKNEALESDERTANSLPQSNRQPNIKSHTNNNNKVVHEHSTQTEINKANPRLRKQMTDMGWQTLLADKTPPNKPFITNSSDMESVKYLVSPTKTQNMRFGDAGSNHDYNTGNTVVENGLHHLELSKNDELLTVSIPSQSSSVEESLDTGERSPLLGQKTSKSKDIYNNRNRDRVSASKLSRLKAIHEKSQSIDVIYI